MAASDKVQNKKKLQVVFPKAEKVKKHLLEKYSKEIEVRIKFFQKIAVKSADITF